VTRVFRTVDFLVGWWWELALWYLSVCLLPIDLVGEGAIRKMGNKDI